MFSKKLQGYKSQDKKFEIYSDYHFIKEDHVKYLLESCDYTCYYCKEKVLMEYEKGDKKQWTLDRKDNTMGHNKNNVLISCLACNLKRRNRTVEKFLFTKQLVIQKVGSDLPEGRTREVRNLQFCPEGRTRVEPIERHIIYC